MDPVHRGWPHSAGSTLANAEQNQSQSSRPGYGLSRHSPSAVPSSLPPPQPNAPFAHFHQQPPSLASIAGINHSSPRQSSSSLSRPEGSQQGLHQGPGLPLPGFSQATGQPGIAERERERAREAEHTHIKEEEDRRHREQERQRMDQVPPHQTPPGPPMHLHQPVAVGPRTVHGPNGLLNSHATQPLQQGPSLPLGAPNGPANMFSGGAVQPATQAHGSGGQPMQPGMLMPFPSNTQPQQSQHQQMQQQNQAPGQGQQPILNDALSYLDQVKVQFADHPDVYNRFLDIMKDFKSGAIDTPGVIGRVSTLFAGNPELIQGFNTFLPPGYRIECGADNDPNAIRVTTPMGTTVSSMPQPRPLSRQEGSIEAARPTNGTFTPQPGQQGQGMRLSPGGRGGLAAALGQQHHIPPVEAVRQQEQQAMHQQQERGVNSLSNAVSAATGVVGPRPGVSPRSTPMPGQHEISVESQVNHGVEKRGPVEFNHAISYVNKIKNRFSAHPDIYKQFLEILQTYQRESKPIQDVYSQVTHLFKTAPDLLEDFKQFLPESAAQAKAAERARQQAEESAMISNVRGDGQYTSPVMSREAQMGTPSHNRGNLPPVGNFAMTPLGKDNKRKRGERQGTAGSVTEPAPAPGIGKAGVHGNQPGKRVKQAHPQVMQKGANDQPPPSSPTLIPALPSPLPPTTTSAATNEELNFFERAKKAIGNKNTMNEFLKLCNLFSQDFIDRSTLVYRAKSFIGGNPDLMKWFTEFVGYDERDIIIENKARETVVPGGRISLSNCRGLGPSYRLLPKRERVKPCSGRDELCNSVLNDEWASHPTWASEDSGFIAHRKNVHEEGLHRIEEERHDYDYNIEACSRTIQLMEPIAQQLRRMSETEQLAYRLPPGLGGQSETIYKRVIMKLYGRDKGQEVITQLHAHPYQVIPVLLNRLKERLETWKMAQREWEKVWREQTQRMFWKSLDHQAVNVRTNDRRQFQTKTLQGEIQVKYEEQRSQEHRIPGSMRGRPQLETIVDDPDVVVDATWLVLVHVEAQGSTDSPRLGPFVRDFVPMFFGISATEFEEKLRQRFGGTPLQQDFLADEPISGADDFATDRRGRKSGKPDDLRRQTLDKKARGKGTRKESESRSRASTPDVTSNAGDMDMTETPLRDIASTPTVEDGTMQKTPSPTDNGSTTRWFNHPITDNSLGVRHVDPDALQKRFVYRLWANTPIYCFVRMFLILYERLAKLKAGESECRDVVKNAKRPKPADDLGIIDKTPQDFFGDVSYGANYYAQMLAKFAQVLEGEIEFTADGVEEALRRFYLQAGYPLYAFEKMVQALARYGTQVVSQDGTNKEKSWDILQLWRKDRSKEEVGAVQATDYRRGVEKFIGGGEGYGIDWDKTNQTVRIFLWKKDDKYFSGDGPTELDQENRWRFYIASYSSIEATDGVDQKDLSPVFLLRNVTAMGADPKSQRYPPVSHQQLNYTAPVGADDAARDSTNEITTGDKILARFLGAKNDERLTLRVAVNNFHPIFQPGTAEGFCEPLQEREGGEQGVKDAEECRHERAEVVKEGFVMMNEGMKDLSRDEVEARNARFAELSKAGDVGQGAGGKSRVDAEDGMAVD